MADTYTVQSGDSLWKIAQKLWGTGTKYQILANLNGISPPYLIHPGQVLKTSGTSGSSKPAASSSSSSSNCPTITGFGLMSGEDRKLFATWTWGKESETKHYKIVWEYCLLADKDGRWFIGSNSDLTVDKEYPSSSRYSTYDIPDNTYSVRFRMLPIADDREVKNGKETNKVPKWQADWTEFKYHYVSDPISPPSAPSVEIDDNNLLTARLENIETLATHAVFQIVHSDSIPFSVSDPPLELDKNFKQVIYNRPVTPGYEYKVRCKFKKGVIQSDWSPFSENVRALPSAPSSITQCRLSGENSDGYSVYLEWGKVNSATSYEIEYTTHKEYFDNGGDTTPVRTPDASTKYTIYKLTGGEYFFRVRAVNEKGSSDWTGIKSVKVGEPPAAPTTWSSTTTVVTGEPLTFYWVHNSEDGSSQTFAELEVSIDGVPIVPNFTIENKDDPDEKDKTSSYAFNTSGYSVGAQISWRVRTAGVTNVYGEWSILRVVDIYAPPTLELTMTDPNGNHIQTLNSFPFYIKAVAGPSTQAPVGYHLTISSDDSYETVDQIGNSRNVVAGEQLYSKYFDINDILMVEMSAGNIDLENGMNYTIKCIVSMNSGLTAESSIPFDVSWTETHNLPNAEISISSDTFSASIHPYCRESTISYSKVTNTDGVYSVTTETVEMDLLDDVYTTTDETVLLGMSSEGTVLYYCAKYLDEFGNPIDPIFYEVTKENGAYVTSSTQLDEDSIQKIYTETNEEVYIGTTSEGDEFYYAIVSSEELVKDVKLSIYRREYDGSFTEIATGISNTANTFISDPHPALDYARYRIVATSDSTGAVSYYDLPGYETGGKAVIIQWNEEWSSFDVNGSDMSSEPAWSGSMLKLPYNIDVSNNTDPDVAIVEYIGRRNPVSYYGTHVGETATWNMDIVKDDVETIYALRRLAIWTGDVYVREPSGTGYWANVKVSFSQKHLELTIPVTLNITRVEGGI